MEHLVKELKEVWTSITHDEQEGCHNPSKKERNCLNRNLWVFHAHGPIEYFFEKYYISGTSLIKSIKQILFSKSFQQGHFLASEQINYLSGICFLTSIFGFPNYIFPLIAWKSPWHSKLQNSHKSINSELEMDKLNSQN